MCGSDGMDGKFRFGFGRLCKLGLIFLIVDMVFWGVVFILV